MKINAQRLVESLSTMARIGATLAGGVTRLALSDEDKQARDLFCRWLEAAGLTVQVDDLGNIYGWRRGEEPDLLPVLVGSHLDSVRQGGKYDGALGTLAALEVVRSLDDAAVRTRRSIGVVAFTAEEGSRFEPSILGPSVITGRFQREYVYNRTCRSTGVRFESELERIGYKGDPANRPPRPEAFVELHIEQGPVLERERLAIGVVEGIVGLNWLQVTLTGQADHAGPSPMGGRRDALVGAARIIEAVRELAWTMGDETVMTVGRLKVEPDIINVIPGKVIFGVDVRNADEEKLAYGVVMVRHLVERIAQSERLDCTIEDVGYLPVTRFDERVVAAVEAATKTLKFSNRRITSGAGHDSQWMARFCPTAMIFVPCKDGKSHCEEEAVTPEQIAQGAAVLAETVLLLAQQ